MSDGNIYLFNNRVITQKEVDRYLKKMGTWHEDISLKKLILILAVLGLCGSVLGVHVLSKKNDKKIETNKTVTSLDSSTKTILHNTAFGYTR